LVQKKELGIIMPTNSTFIYMDLEQVLVIKYNFLKLWDFIIYTLRIIRKKGRDLLEIIPKSQDSIIFG